LHETEFVDVGGSAPLQPVVDLQQRYGDVLAFVVYEEHALGFVVDRGAAETSTNEIGVEHPTAKLTVGDRLKSDLFLHRNCLADVVVLDAPQVGEREASGFMIGAGVQERSGSQK
jgi:hypothetical protein